ncbi:hypothetical protein LC612_43350 [Nostoc sp. CHAB 5834]|nr:hypothetical protein [Nostoc sp. CHAB 5834]
MIKTQRTMKKVRTITIPLLLAVFMTACTPSMNFLASSVVPAATGKAHVKRDKNENYVVKIDVQNLAPADRLSPPQRTYIAWMESDGNTIKKLGLLEPRSQRLNASLTTTAVAAPSRIFVTAESGPEIQYPAGMEVLATQRK